MTITPEARAKALANAMARHIIGESFAAEDETCAVCVELAASAIRAAENDALERAAAYVEHPGGCGSKFDADVIRSMATLDLRTATKD